MKIGIVGSGHVGLVTGSCFADWGNDVICLDHDKRKITGLLNGKVPFYEPGLAELIFKNQVQKRLRFTTSIQETVQFGVVIFLCVGTPPREDGHADLAAVENVAKAIAVHVTDYRVIVEKSTVPVKTGKQLASIIRRGLRGKVPFDVASNSEFLREGQAVQDFFNPDRIVLGVNSKRAEQLLVELYQPFKAPIVITNLESAELIKHASNSFLAMKISFINLMSQICEKVGADVTKVAEGMGADRRIGQAFLNAGVGFGGSCFPKDLLAFTRIFEQLNLPSNFLKEISRVNEVQKINFIEKIKTRLGSLKGKTIAALGLSFKPDTNDMRFAPSVDILNRLKAEGTLIKAYDPRAISEAKKMIKGIEYSKNAYDACRNADALLILTEWREFRELDLKRLKKLLKRPVVIDGRNIYDPEVMKKHGFRYYSVGR